jgi:hypothetical protein
MPRYTTPQLYSPKSSTTDTQVTLELNNVSSIIMESVVQSVLQLAWLLNCMPRGGQSQMALELMIPVCKIAHDILVLPRLSQDDISHARRTTNSKQVPAPVAAELVRVSAVALLSTVLTTTSRDPLCGPNYRKGLDDGIAPFIWDYSWAGLEHVKLWVMAIQVLMNPGPWRMRFVDEIARVMDSLSVNSWQGLLACLHQVAWIEHIAKEDMARMESDLKERPGR